MDDRGRQQKKPKYQALNRRSRPQTRVSSSSPSAPPPPPEAGTPEPEAQQSSTSSSHPQAQQSSTSSSRPRALTIPLPPHLRKSFLGGEQRHQMPKIVRTTLETEGAKFDKFIKRRPPRPPPQGQEATSEPPPVVEVPPPPKAKPRIAPARFPTRRSVGIAGQRRKNSWDKKKPPPPQQATPKVEEPSPPPEPSVAAAQTQTSSARFNLIVVKSKGRVRPQSAPLPTRPREFNFQKATVSSRIKKVGAEGLELEDITRKFPPPPPLPHHHHHHHHHHEHDPNDHEHHSHHHHHHILHHHRPTVKRPPRKVKRSLWKRMSRKKKTSDPTKTPGPKDQGDSSSGDEAGKVGSGLLEDLDCDWESLNFSSDVSASDSDQSGRPDNSWILGMNAEDGVDVEATTTEDEVEELEHDDDVSVKMTYLFQILWLLTLVGRWPFQVDQNRRNGKIRVSLKTRWWQVMESWVLAVLMTLLFLLYVFELTTVFAGGAERPFSGNRSEPGYLKLEQLLLQKHWLYYVIFLLTFTLVIAGIWTFQISKASIQFFLNDYAAVVHKLKYPEDVHLNLSGILYGIIFLTVVDIMLLVILVTTNAYGFGEAQKSLTSLFLRWVEPNVFLSLLARSGTGWLCRCVVLFVELYVYVLARNYIVLIIALSQGVRNSGGRWYARCVTYLITRFPAYESPLDEEEKKTLSCARILYEHLLITKMVRGLSNNFIPVYLVFFCAKVFALACICFKLGLFIAFDLKLKGVGETVDNTGKAVVKYNQSKEEELFEMIYFMIFVMFGLWTFCVVVSEAGEISMQCYEPIRRYGLVHAKNNQERKFIQSMYMSYGERNSHYVKPGNFFVLSKGFFVAVLGAAVSIWLVMMSCNISNLVETSILLPCERGNKLCVSTSPKNIAPGESPEVRVPVPFIVETVPPDEATTTTTLATTPGHVKDTVDIPIPEEEKKVKEERHKCGFYCGKTLVYRNELKDMTALDWQKDRDLLNCITNPYRNPNPSRRPEFKCDDGKIKDRAMDSLGMFQFYLGGAVSTRNNPDPSTPSFCWHYSDPQYQHGLEGCGMPFAYRKAIETARDGTTSTTVIDSKLNTAFAPKGSAYQDLDKHLFNDPNNRPVIKDKFHCNQLTNKPISPTTDEKIALKFTYTVAGKQLTYFRLRVFNNEGKEVSMLPYSRRVYDFKRGAVVEESETEVLHRLWTHPYSYVPPIMSKDNQDGTQKKILSFGLYDCFGEPLKHMDKNRIVQWFDECGGLPFTVWKKVGASYKEVRPEWKEVQMTGGGGHLCWESWIPNTACGVPLKAEKPDAEEDKVILALCDTWKKYRDNKDWSGKTL